MAAQIYTADANGDGELDYFDSPIEATMAQALYDNLAVHGLMIRPQYHLGRYFFDFAIQLQGDKKPSILIECDGMAFHSSPEQVLNDERKNKIAFENSMIILRFTGRDINERTQFCADTLRSIVDRLSAQRPN